MFLFDARDNVRAEEARGSIEANCQSAVIDPVTAY
jgi:hypothetical protein